jgi:hypothetical protein
MASSGKKRTTMAKLNREARLRERRFEKEARKVERKSAAAAGPQPEESGDGFTEHDDFSDQTSPEAGVSQTP